jgi:hypothetical protein
MPTDESNVHPNQKVKVMTKICSALINIIATTVVLSLTACGGGGSGSDGTGTLSLGITDAPVQNEDIAEVWVRFTQVTIHPTDGSSDIVMDVVNDDGDPWRDIDLKSLTNGNTMLLGEIELAAGHYSWIRLDIDPAYTYINETDVPDETPVIEGNPTLLDCSSCDESHLKLNRSFTIENGGWINFTIDFDLQKSLTLQIPQSVKPRPDYAYKLRPTLRIIDAELASTFIWGSVENPADPTGCSVYVYNGTPTTLDDMCVDDPPGVYCEEADTQRPLAKVDVIDNGGTFDYRTGPLYPGIYTVAVVCEPDDIDLDSDVLTYIGTQEVDATLDPPDGLGVEANFLPAP